MPKITHSDIWKVPGPAGPILERAGVHPSHGLAIQSVANDLERIVISRCATPAGIQLLDEGYASKGFGIKAKSCDWGPFTGFAMAHIEYSKFADGSSLAAYNKQKNFFDHARSDTGFLATDVGGRAALAGQAHSSMAEADVLKLSKPRLEYLKRQNVIQFEAVYDGARIYCDSPFGRLMFILANLKTGSSATWGILHRDNFKRAAGVDTTLADGGQWTFARGMANTAPGGTPHDPHRRCCTGDYDLWGVFAKRNSTVASTRSLAQHGMDRQMQVFSAAMPGVSQGIKARVGQLQKATMKQAVARTHHVYGKYTEDREKGNISALTLHTAREMNRRIRANGYKGGDMFHHNDDLGNPFRSDVEEDLIAWVPGEMVPHFIESTKTGKGANGHIGGNAWVKRYEADYVVYDNAAIHRAR